MAINFNELPNENTARFPVPAKGFYRAKIEKAEMREPKNGGADYLSVTLNLFDVNGRSVGRVWDILSESDKDIVRYKLKRFITALSIPITGNFELKDLIKIIVNKELIVNTTTEQQEGRPERAIVDIFSNDIYYPLSETEKLLGVTMYEDIAIDEDDEVPFTDEPTTAEVDY